MKGEFLDGWKAIATHLEVSVRTAQKWEKEEGLPVRRREGEKPRVYARRSEIEAWNEHMRAAASRSKRQAALSRKPLVTGAFACLAILSVTAAWQLVTQPGLPASIERTGVTFTVLDDNGRVCWTHTFPDLLEAAYNDYESGNMRRRGRLYWVTDLDSDGWPEVLLVHVPDDANGQTSTLFCFRADGTKRWEFKFGRTVTLDGRFFPHTYEGSIIGIAENSAKRFLVALGVQQPDFPSQVVLLNPLNGTLVDDYWHPGRFYATKLCDLDQDGTNELVLAGINNPGNGLGHPALAVLNIPFDDGKPTTPDYFGNPGGKERAYRLFPRPSLFDAMSFPPSAFGISCWPNGRLHLDIGRGNLYKIVYAFDQHLDLQGVYPSDNFLERHTQLYAENRIIHPAGHERQDWEQVLSFPTAPDGNALEIEAMFQEARVKTEDDASK